MGAQLLILVFAAALIWLLPVVAGLFYSSLARRVPGGRVVAMILSIVAATALYAVALLLWGLFVGALFLDDVKDR